MTTQEFEQHYAQQNSRLHRWVSRQLRRDASVVDDVCSDTWLLAWRFREDFDSRASFKTWLTAIALNVIRSLYRAEKHRIASGISISEEMADLFSTGEDLEKRVTARLKLESVMAAISERNRGLFRMRFVYGLAHGEIAALTGVCAHTVKTRLRRELENL